MQPYPKYYQIEKVMVRPCQILTLLLLTLLLGKNSMTNRLLCKTLIP